jgi:hypothetical protein
MEKYPTRFQNPPGSPFGNTAQNDLGTSRLFDLYVVVDTEFVVVGNYSDGELIESESFVWHSNGNERTPWKFCYGVIVFSLFFFHL